MDISRSLRPIFGDISSQSWRKIWKSMPILQVRMRQISTKRNLLFDYLRKSSKIISESYSALEHGLFRELTHTKLTISTLHHIIFILVKASQKYNENENANSSYWLLQTSSLHVKRDEARNNKCNLLRVHPRPTAMTPNRHLPMLRKGTRDMDHEYRKAPRCVKMGVSM